MYAQDAERGRRRSRLDPGSIGVRFGPKLLATIESEAHRRRIGVSALCRQAMQEFCDAIPVAETSSEALVEGELAGRGFQKSKKGDFADELNSAYEEEMNKLER